jgi:hypothetical protein
MRGASVGGSFLEFGDREQGRHTVLRRVYDQV